MGHNGNQNIFRWSGLLIIIGSTLLTIGYWLRPYSEKQFAQDFAGDAALYSSILVGIGILLLLPGLPTLFYHQMKDGIAWSFGALTFTFIGLAAFHLGTLALYFVLPMLVTYSTDTYQLIAQDVPPFPRFAIFWLLSLFVQVCGLIAYGIKMLRTKAASQNATFILLAGAFLLILAPLFNFRLLQPAVTCVMAGFILYGITLTRSNISVQ